jgi:acyl-CoA synthetase (AMP-forming)/AMP-acid ligase II
MTDPILHGFEGRLRRPGEAMVASRDRVATVEGVDRMARSLADPLRGSGVAEGSIVALAAPNGPGFLAALLAVRRHRCAALLHDCRAPAAERERIAQALGVAATVDCRRAWPRGPSDFTVEPAAAGGASLSPETAVVKLTSGSTGSPKGIATPSAALVADDRALAATMGLSPDERILVAIPMSHSYGLSSVVLPALMRRSLLVVPEGGGPLDPVVSAQAHEVTFFPTVPAFLQALVKIAKPLRLPASLRLVITAGELLQPATATSFRERYGRPVHVFYGASECGGIAFDRTGTAGERGTVGSPVEGVEVTLQPVAGISPGSGAVTVRSAAVASGYLPEAEPSLAGGCFRTQDLASYRDGELVLEGRLDDLINVRGKKINPREVERVLACLEGVEDVVVMGVTPPGRDDVVVRSFVACRPGAASPASIQLWCRRHLANHKVPRSIVLLDEIPRTDRGKLDRAALLEMGEAGGRSGRG